MLLQLALDFVRMDEVFDLIEGTKDFVDVFEMGTPLLLREGVASLRRVRGLHPEIRLLADAKIVDGGYGEASLLFEAGADVVTVLAVASTETLAAVRRAADNARGSVVADLIASSDPVADIGRLAREGIDIACVHRAADSGSWEGGNSHLLSEITERKGQVQIMVAGGIDLDIVRTLVPYAPDIVVVGSGIVRADNPGEEARKIHEALTTATG